MKILLHNFLKNKKLLLLTIGIGLILIFYYLPKPGDKKPVISEEILEEQRQIEQRVTSGLVKQGIVDFWKKKNISFEEDFTQTDLDKLAKPVYVLEVESLDPSEVSSIFKIKEVLSNGENFMRFSTDLNKGLVLREYLKVLNDSVESIEGQEKPVFSVKLVSTENVMVGEEGTDILASLAPTHSVENYRIFLDGYDFTSSLGYTEIALTFPIKGNGETIVATPNFFPLSLKIHSPVTFTPGLKTITPTIPKSAAFFDHFFNEIITQPMSRDDFEPVSNSTTILYVYDKESKSIMPYLSKEARFKKIKNPSDNLIFVSVLEN